MSNEVFDCVVVGARCAGAPLATHLGRAGMRVCVLDAAKLPSGQPFSTHAIQPAGIDYLEELGVAPNIRALTPPVPTSRLVVGHSAVDIKCASGRELYCPRRSTLDPLLLDAAVAAGAEVRDETAVLELLRDGDRVTGVRSRHAGITTDLRARWVVGADGRNSTVAKQVGAEEYYASEAQRGGYWGYYPVTASLRALPFQTYIEIRGTASRFFFLTDGGLVIAGALDESSVARTWTSDPERAVRESLSRSDVTSTIVENGNAPVGDVVGLQKLSCFFRVPVGPGWALVGDAGLHKDPSPGYGITDALRDAKALSTALLDGRDAALEVYWRKRDVDSIALYANATAMGSLDYDNPLNRILIGKLGATPGVNARLQDVLDRKRSPFDIVAPWRVFAWTAGALLRGKTEVWAPFKAAAKRGAWVDEETTRRTTLLKDAERRLTDSLRY